MAKKIVGQKRKDIVKLAKKDSDFKTLVDNIVFYAEGGYIEQRMCAEEVVRNGPENASAETIGEVVSSRKPSR